MCAFYGTGCNGRLRRQVGANNWSGRALNAPNRFQQLEWLHLHGRCDIPRVCVGYSSCWAAGSSCFLGCFLFLFFCSFLFFLFFFFSFSSFFLDLIFSFIPFKFIYVASACNCVSSRTDLRDSQIGCSRGRLHPRELSREEKRDTTV